MKIFSTSVLFTLLHFSMGALIPTTVNAWQIKGKWSTAVFNCQGTSVKIGVDMNSRVGGGDASPVRTAYMTIGGSKLDSVWIVGASMNTLSTNNRNHELVLGNTNVYLNSIGYKKRVCVSY